MGLALFAFIAIFLLIGSAGLLMFYRAAMLQRLSAVISPHSEEENWLIRLKKKGAGALNAYVRNVRLKLFSEAKSVIVEATHE